MSDQIPQKHDESRKVIITERVKLGKKIKPTTQSRKELYELIARFRKNAETSTDTPTRKLYEIAAEVLAKLIRLFKQHEQNTETTTNDDKTE